jgi:hypothetical protein
MVRMRKVVLLIGVSTSIGVKAQVRSHEVYKINNAQGFIIATLTVTNNDIQEVRDTKGTYLGMYIGRRNITYDSTGVVFSKGNKIDELISRPINEY